MFVRSLRHHPSVFQFHNSVAAPHGGEPVGDEQDSEVAAKSFDGIHHRLFGGVVEGAGGFVEHQHAGLLVERAGDADALALATGETDAALSHIGLVSLRTAFNKIRNLCLTCRLLHPIQI